MNAIWTLEESPTQVQKCGCWRWCERSSASGEDSLESVIGLEINSSNSDNGEVDNDSTKDELEGEKTQVANHDERRMTTIIEASEWCFKEKSHQLFQNISGQKECPVEKENIVINPQTPKRDQNDQVDKHVFLVEWGGTGS